MKLSVSNIAWDVKDDDKMYLYLADQGITGIEIAPTRIFPESPYDRVKEGKSFAIQLREQYGLEIVSMQSIWYGRHEEVFSDDVQRRTLIEYTKKAFAFAHALNCRNLVFGCPGNRNIKSSDDRKVAEDFFYELGECARKEDTILALEANPCVYGTNFLNYTKEVYHFIKYLPQTGLRINYDLGTVIYNSESVSDIDTYIKYINHIHISEPFLETVRVRNIHRKLFQRLRQLQYDYYVSAEMKNTGRMTPVQNFIREMKEVMEREEKV